MIKLRKTFPGKTPDDEIVLIIKKHWIKYLAVLTIAIFMLSIPAIGTYLLIINLNDLSLLAVLSITSGIGLSLLALNAMLFYSFVDYYLDMTVVTSKKVIDIKQHGFFNQATEEVHLSDIESVEAKIKGIIPYYLDYGDIYIHTADESATFIVTNIPNPNAVTRKIIELHEKVSSTNSKEKLESK